MRSVEASARTRQEAIQKALDELGVELHEVQIEILHEGSRGLFGLGARDVRVRVTAEHLPEVLPKTEKPARRPREERRPPKTERPPRTETLRKPERHARPERPAKPEGGPKPKPAAAEEKPPVQKLAPVSEGRRQEAAALLSEVIAKMGMEATVSHEPTEDGGVRLNVQSNDSAILIGRKGKNLQALQYLVNRMATAAETTEMPERILVDIENYLDRRRASLEEMARQLAQKAKESGRDIRLKPLSPQERRIIHLTLQDDPDVRTFSMGNSVLRTVVISPKSAGRDEGRPKRQRGGAGRRDARDRGPRSRRPSGERPPAQETNQPSEPAQEPGQPSEPAQGDTQEP